MLPHIQMQRSLAMAGHPKTPEAWQAPHENRRHNRPADPGMGANSPRNASAYSIAMPPFTCKVAPVT